MPDMNIFAYTRYNKKQYKTKQPAKWDGKNSCRPHNCFNYKDPIHHL